MTESFDWTQLDERDGPLPQTSPRRTPAADAFTPKQLSALLGSSVSVAIVFALPVALLAGIPYPTALVVVGAVCVLTAAAIGALRAAGDGPPGTACRVLGNLLYGLLCVCGVIGLVSFAVLWVFVHSCAQECSGADGGWRVPRGEARGVGQSDPDAVAGRPWCVARGDLGE